MKDPKFMKKVDLIWDNPPYTSPETKERVLRALVESGKPFAMLLPISVLHVGFVREIVDMEQVWHASSRTHLPSERKEDWIMGVASLADCCGR